MPLRLIDVLLQQMTTMMEEGHYEEALQKGRTLLAMLPEDQLRNRALTFLHMGTSYTGLAKYAEAETHYAAAVLGYAHDSVLWYNRALNLWTWASAVQQSEDVAGIQGRLQQALEYALEGQRLNPTNSDIRELIAVLRRSI